MRPLRQDAQDEEDSPHPREGAHGRAALHLLRLRQRLQVRQRPQHTHEARAQDPDARHEADREEGEEEEGILMRIMNLIWQHLVTPYNNWSPRGPDHALICGANYLHEI